MKKYLIILILVVLCLPSLLPFFHKGFFWTQDIIYLTRISEAANALTDGQFPLRWVSELRYGEPLFNYYAPLPYYFGSIIHFIGINFITTAKISFILISLASAFSMYLLGKELWGKYGGFISAALYTYSPYRAVDMYIRGAYSETFAFVWFPLIILFTIKYYRSPQRRFLLLGSFSYALLLLTHNIMALAFLPFYLGLLLTLNISSRNVSFFFKTIFSLTLSFGLAATYWIPAFFEKGFVKSESTKLSLDYFVNQFVKFPELIKPAWDGVSINHEIGLIHLILFALSITTAFVIFSRRKKLSLVIIFLSLLFVFSVFIQTLPSLSIWLFLEPLSFIQFPWRFAGISMFFISILGGSFFILFKSNKHSLLLTIITVMIIILFQVNYFKPNKFEVNATDKNYIKLEEAYLPKEYLPIGVKENPPKEINQPVNAQNLQLLNVTNINKKSNSYHFTVEVDKLTEVIVPIYYFPGWKSETNNATIEIKRQPKTGLITLTVPPGNNTINLRFEDTKLRTFSNLVSLFSIILVGGLFTFGRRKSTAQLKNIS